MSRIVLAIVYAFALAAFGFSSAVEASPSLSVQSRYGNLCKLLGLGGPVVNSAIAIVCLPDAPRR